MGCITGVIMQYPGVGDVAGCMEYRFEGILGEHLRSSLRFRVRVRGSSSYVRCRVSVSTC